MNRLSKPTAANGSATPLNRKPHWLRLISQPKQRESNGALAPLTLRGRNPPKGKVKNRGDGSPSANTEARGMAREKQSRSHAPCHVPCSGPTAPARHPEPLIHASKKTRGPGQSPERLRGTIPNPTTGMEPKHDVGVERGKPSERRYSECRRHKSARPEANPPKITRSQLGNLERC